MDASAREIRLGLWENIGQFSLLVLVNAFVGSMVGLERTVVPLIGEREFGLSSKTAIVSFIVSFGVVKVLCKLFAARISETRWKYRPSNGDWAIVKDWDCLKCGLCVQRCPSKALSFQN